MRSRSLTRLAQLICLSTVVLGLMLALVSPARAASYRNHIARVPATPFPTQTVRIWMDSDTVSGETAGIEYHAVDTETYVRVLGTYDNVGWPGANWYAEIPAFPTGTQIEYQLFTRNQSGGDDGFTGFNWSYTVRDTQFAAQLPIVPVYTQSPRVWISSTILPPGEAGLIIDPAGSPTYAGIYTPTGYTGANWYVDLPVQPVGTLVAYHFYSDDHAGRRNENFDGRSYIVADLPDFVYVDDSWAGAVAGSDLGQPGVYNFGGNAFATVQGGARGVAPAGTVNIYSGSYTDNIVITKSLTLNGWDAADTITIRPTISNSNCTGGSLCNGAASNLILVQANNVTIHNLTLDGINPSLGPGIAARNGIIENHAVGTFNNLTVSDTTIRNIYLRGLYASSGGSNFNLHHNTVQNVQGDLAGSIAIMNFGGSGRIADNVVSEANDAIAANWSRGTYIQDNAITASGSGVHTDNNGGLGGNADVLERNTVSNCTTGGYGVWVFAPYRDVSVQYNTITGCAVGLAVAGQNASAAPTFFDNEVDGQSLPGSMGIYVTTDQFGFDSNNVSASFDYNNIANTAIGISLEQAQITRTLQSTLTNLSLLNNTTALSMTGGTVTFAGNNVDTGAAAITQSGGALLAYANNFLHYASAGSRSAGTANLAHNWWGTYSVTPTLVSASDWQARLGAQIVVWAQGNGSAVMDNNANGGTGIVTMGGGTGTAVIVNHGNRIDNAPFGNATFDSNRLCSNYYDFFTVNGSGTWNVSVPVDIAVEACVTQTLNPGKIYWIPPTTNYNVECTSGNSACWDPVMPTSVITGDQNITVSGLSVANLGGTQFVAGSITGSDPTAVTIVGFAATTDRSSTPARIILVSAVIVAAGLVLVARRRR